MFVMGAGDGSGPDRRERSSTRVAAEDGGRVPPHGERAGTRRAARATGGGAAGASPTPRTKITITISK